MEQPQHEAEQPQHEAEEAEGEIVTTKTRRQCNSSYAMSEEEDTDDDNDSDFDPGAIVDSDYDMNDGDDDLYADNVDMDEPEDKQVRGKQLGKDSAKEKDSEKGKDKAGDKGKEKQEDELYESEGDDLWPPDEDDEELYMKFKSFREEDLNCPKFHVGQVFQTVELLRTAIK